MVARTKTELKAEVDASITTNGQGAVTAAILRTVMHNFIDSMLADSDGKITISDVENLQTTLDALSGATGSGSALQLKQDVNVRAEATATGLKLYIPVYSDNAQAKNGGLQDGELYRDASGNVHIVLPSVANPLPNSVTPSQFNPVNAKVTPQGTLFLAYKGKRWEFYSPQQPWHLTSTDDDWLRFEVRSTDLYTSPSWTDPTGTNRNRMGEESAVWHPKTDNFLIEGEFRIEAPTITSGWYQVWELHTYAAGGAATPTAYKCQLRIVGQKLQIDAPYNNGTGGSSAERILWSSPGNIVYDKVYKWKMYCAGGGSNGRIIFELDGQRVLDWTGYVGYSTEDKVEFGFGQYRGNNNGAWTPETNVMWQRLLSFSAGNVAAPAAPVQTPDTYGPNLVTAGNNGAMDNATGFTTSNSTLASVSGQLEITKTLATPDDGNANCTITVQTGRVYQLDVDMMTVDGAADLWAAVNVYSDAANAGAGGNLLYRETNEKVMTPISARFTADADTTLNVYLHAYSASATQKARFDNLKVREVNPGS